MIGGDKQPPAADQAEIGSGNEAQLLDTVASGVAAARAAALRRYATPLARFCTAAVGEAQRAQALVDATVTAAREQSAGYAGQEPLGAWLFSLALRTSGQKLEHGALAEAHPAEGTRTPLTDRAQAARSLLGELSVSERDALLLRYVAGLSCDELAMACGVDELVARQRLAEALTALCQRLGTADPLPGDPDQRRRVSENLPGLLEGTAPQELLELARTNDELRGLLDLAERALGSVRDAGADAVQAPDLEERFAAVFTPSPTTDHGAAAPSAGNQEALPRENGFPEEEPPTMPKGLGVPEPSREPEGAAQAQGAAAAKPEPEHKPEAHSAQLEPLLAVASESEWDSERTTAIYVNTPGDVPSTAASSEVDPEGTPATPADEPREHAAREEAKVPEGEPSKAREDAEAKAPAATEPKAPPPAEQAKAEPPAAEQVAAEPVPSEQVDAQPDQPPQASARPRPRGRRSLPKPSLVETDSSEAPAESEATRAPVEMTTSASAAATARHRLWARSALVGGAAVLAAIVFAVVAPRWEKPKVEAPSTPPWTGVVALLASAGPKGLEGCDAEGQSCHPLSQGDRLGGGASIRTDQRTRARLKMSDGTELTLDRSTRIRLSTTRERDVRLETGILVADVAPDSSRRMRVEAPAGFLEVVSTKFTVAATRETMSVEVSRGEVRLVDPQGRDVALRPGEAGRLERGIAPCATSTPRLSDSFGWSDWANDPADPALSTRGLGEVRGKKPGDPQGGEQPFTLSAHRVKVLVEGALARTEVEEVFTNPSEDPSEGVYRFALPTGARIERVALESNGNEQEAAFIDRERATALLGEIALPRKPRPRDEMVWAAEAWRDPAQVDWQRGGRLELRMGTIPSQGSRKVVLAYAEELAPTCGVRRYTYPLAFHANTGLKVEDFAVEASISGHDQKFGVRAIGYELAKRSPGPETEGLTLKARGFVPAGDLSLEFALPARDSDLSVWASQPAPTHPPAGAAGAAKPAEEPQYIALALRPKLPRVGSEEHRALALVVDSSRSMFGERYRRAQAVATRILRELDREDRFTLLACDTGCRTLSGGLREPGPTTAEEARRFLAEIVPEGASDVAGAIVSAASAVSADSDRVPRVVYLGDGLSTTGTLRPELVRRALETGLPAARAMAVALGIGSDADMDLLRAGMRGLSGVVLAYRPGQSTAEAAFSVLGAAYVPWLRAGRVHLPEGLTDVAPEQVDSLPSGGELWVVARMAQPEVRGTVELAGKVGDRPFEQQVSLPATLSSVPKVAFLPSLHAARSIGELDQKPEAKATQRVIELSRRFHQPSRHTLLVLNGQILLSGAAPAASVPDWTGPVLPDLEAGAKPAQVTAGEAAPAGQSGASAEAASVSANAPVLEYEPFPDTDRTWIKRAPKRIGEVTTERTEPKVASAEALARAERDFAQNENRRASLKRLYGLVALRGDLERARGLVDRWLDKDPLDPEALGARADLAARMGDREGAIRMLGSVIDANPGDVRTQLRLARLHRWAGRNALACRHSLAIAQIAKRDSDFIAEAVRCARENSAAPLGDALLEAADAAQRARIEQLLAEPVPPTKLVGDLRLEAKWNPGSDLDLALLDGAGQRISWLGTPSRVVVSATDALSTEQEGLAVRGAKLGEYVLEIVRASGTGVVSGTVAVTVADTTRTVPFKLEGTRVVVGLVILRTEAQMEAR